VSAASFISVSTENSNEMLSVTITAEVAVSDPYYSGAGLRSFLNRQEVLYKAV
jgi:hypothetical protein